LQEIRNLTGLSVGELRSLRGHIGHVPERSDGARKSVKRLDFFRAWLAFQEPVEDEHTTRKKVALTIKAEQEAERAQLELARVRGQLIDVETVRQIYNAIGDKISEGAKLASTIAPEALQIVLDSLDAAETVLAEINNQGGQQ